MRRGNCEICGKAFETTRINRKYCDVNCRVKAYQLRKKQENHEIKKSVTAKSIDYARLTFILSFIGFLGSIGFYFGVLREVYSPKRDKQEISVLKAQNKALQNAVNILVSELETDQSSAN